MDVRRIAAEGTIFRTCMLAFGLMLQSACSTFRGHPDVVHDPEAELRELAPLHSVAARLACMENPTLVCRNRIAAVGMRAVDIRFSQFESRLFRQNREAGFGATMATLGLTTAATLTGGSARAFAASAGLITAGRESFDKELLAQQTTLSIHTAMRARRATAATRVVTGMHAPLAAYSPNDLERDLRVYEDAGSVLSALIDVNEVVSVVAKKAETELQQTIQFRLDPSAHKLRDAICRDENCTSRDDAKLQQLLGCMRSAGVVVELQELTHFWFEPDFAADREKVLPCMNL